MEPKLPKLTEGQRDWLIDRMFDKFHTYDEHMSMTALQLYNFLNVYTEEQHCPECPLCKKSKLKKVEKPGFWYWACPHCDSTYNSDHFANTEEHGWDDEIQGYYMDKEMYDMLVALEKQLTANTEEQPSCKMCGKWQDMYNKQVETNRELLANAEEQPKVDNIHCKECGEFIGVGLLMHETEEQLCPECEQSLKEHGKIVHHCPKCGGE